MIHTTYLVLDCKRKINNDSKPTAFEPIAYIDMPYIPYAGGTAYQKTLENIAYCLIEQACNKNILPIDWDAQELPTDRYMAVMQPRQAIEDFKPFIPELKQEFGANLIYDETNKPVAIYGNAFEIDESEIQAALCDSNGKHQYRMEEVQLYELDLPLDYELKQIL